MGIHLRVFLEGYPMNTNMTGFKGLKKNCAFLHWTKVALALEGLRDGYFLEELLRVKGLMKSTWKVRRRLRRRRRSRSGLLYMYAGIDSGWLA